jgi:hypothetical protein
MADAGQRSCCGKAFVLYCWPPVARAVDSDKLDAARAKVAEYLEHEAGNL